MVDYVLMGRSLAFSERIVKVHQFVTEKSKEFNLANQVLRSGTAIGAYIFQADAALSEEDCLAKLQQALQKTAETEYWLLLLISCGYYPDRDGSMKEDCRELKKMLADSIDTAQKAASRGNPDSSNNGGLKMKVLVIGSGGREHALVLKLLESPLVDEIWCAPGNGGISAVAHPVPIKVMDKENMVKFAVENGIEFVVVAPDDPLAAGMVDAFEEVHIPTFGPKAGAAIIEASKVFSKNLMKKYGIPTAQYETFEDESAAIAYVKAQNSYPAVIKADGLALGKGVIIAQSEAEAVEAIHEMMSEGKFGDSGRRVVIEEFLTGPEVSVLSFTDGHTIVPMISSKDHKRANDNDEGLNTGGMGTIAPNPYYTPEIAAECMETIFLPTMKAMNAEGRPFKGCLYFGLMLTPKGPKVIEYNCRFGDPETQVVLPLLKTDLMEIMLAIYEERLSEVDVQFSDEAASCVVLASGGYPVRYKSGYEIHGLDEKGQAEGVIVYHAGTKLENGKFYTAGGRVLGVTALGKDREESLRKAYAAAEKITFTDVHYRHDIGKIK